MNHDKGQEGVEKRGEHAEKEEQDSREGVEGKNSAEMREEAAEKRETSDEGSKQPLPGATVLFKVHIALCM